MICFDQTQNKACNLFDGFNVTPSSPSIEGHWASGLGLYKGKPAAVGGRKFPFSNEGYSEALFGDEWQILPAHPKYV